MASLQQDDFSAGIFRGRRAPKNSVYDAVNALISDEAELFRRGGSEYKSGSDADDTILGLWEGHTAVGQRTVFWSDSSLYVLDSNDSSLVTLSSTVPNPGTTGVEIGGFVFFPAANYATAGNSLGSPTEIVYAGSRKTASYSTGSAATTLGSEVVTGSGTSWLANVDAGMILSSSAAGGAVLGVVKSVESDTSLTLTRAAAQTVGAGSYTLHNAYQGIVYGDNQGGVGSDEYVAKNPTTFFHTVAGQRLLRALDNRVFFSRTITDELFLVGHTPDYAVLIDDRQADYHEIPQGVAVAGVSAINDAAFIFTTGGVWAITNMALDAVDAFGNIQHQVAQISQQVILWGHQGLAARENVLIVPAIDDVYALTLGATPQALSEAIRPLYREYVEAGYKPGIATVFRGHYILPILDSSNAVQDTLVCRLDRGPAWTRWANGASGRAYARRVGSTTREPKLLGLDGLRVSDLTGAFDPDSTRKDDADGTDHALTVTTSDYPLGPGLQKGHCIRVRANYSLVDAASDNPTTVMQWSRGPEGSSFTTVTATRGGGESDGTEYSSWPINKAAEFIRFKWATSGAATSAVLRRIEIIFRPSGRQ